MRRNWLFSGARGSWHWRATDVVTGALIQHAQSRFATLLDCIRDAERHGYRRFADDKHEYRIGGPSLVAMAGMRP